MVFNMISLCILLFVVLSAFAMPEPVSYNPLPMNNVEAAILAISDRLRTLDFFILASPKWGLILDSNSHKLESLESKISRLETFLDLKIEKLAEAYHSKTVKEELAREQLSGKIDKVYERLNHRMSYTESRIESCVVKQKNTLDGTLNGITQQLENLDNDVTEIATSLDEVKLTLTNFNVSFLNNTDVESTSSHFNSESMKKIESIGEQFNNFASKVSTIFHDTSTKIKGNEDMLRSLLDIFTSMKKEMQDANHNLKTLKKQACPNEHLEFLMDKVENMARENEANYERLDNNIERLHAKQELYQESCHRIQEDEIQIESRIGHTLDKILDSIDNRTLITDRNYDTILERLKSLNFATRITGQCTNTILKLKEQLSQDFRLLVHDLTINNPTYGKMDVIINNLKQLQEQIVQLNITLSCAKENSISLMKSQKILNSTSTILQLIKKLNESINVVIDKIDQEHRGFPDWSESEDSEKATKKILDILNVTDAELSARPKKHERQITANFKGENEEEEEDGEEEQEKTVDGEKATATTVPQHGHDLLIHV